MANERLTRPEFDIVLIEQTIHVMIQIDPTIAQAVDINQQSADLTVLQQLQKTASAVKGSESAALV